MDKLSPPSNTKLVDNNGYLTQSWQMWINVLYRQVGGSTASSNTLLERAIIDNRNNISTIKGNINNIESNISHIELDISNISSSINTINNEKMNDVQSTGSGKTLIKDKQNNIVYLKSIKALNLIKLNETANDLTISSKTITSGSGITINESNDIITISTKNTPKTLDIINVPFLTAPGQITVDLSTYGLNNLENRIIHKLSAICLSGDVGYSVGDEVDFLFSDGTIHGQPYTITNQYLKIQQLPIIKIVNTTTNTYVNADATKWQLSIKLIKVFL